MNFQLNHSTDRRRIRRFFEGFYALAFSNRYFQFAVVIMYIILVSLAFVGIHRLNIGFDVRNLLF